MREPRPGTFPLMLDPQKKIPLISPKDSQSVFDPSTTEIFPPPLVHQSFYEDRRSPPAARRLFPWCQTPYRLPFVGVVFNCLDCCLTVLLLFHSCSSPAGCRKPTHSCYPRKLSCDRFPPRCENLLGWRPQAFFWPLTAEVTSLVFGKAFSHRSKWSINGKCGYVLWINKRRGKVSPPGVSMTGWQSMIFGCIHG